MSNISIVTGAGTGIGRATALALAARGNRVIAIGRREDKLKETQALAPQQIEIVVADVGTAEGRETILEKVKNYPAISHLIHNAAVVEPVAFMKDVTIADWRHAQAINVEAPLFLTQALLPQLRHGRILHISSGVAHFAVAGWGAYCTSKAALFMLYQCLKLELASDDIAVGSVMPGIADTAMQGLLRHADNMREEDRSFFQNLFDSKRLVPAETVGAFLAWLLCDIDKTEFSEKEWDIYDKQHHSRWSKDLYLPDFKD